MYQVGTTGGRRGGLGLWKGGGHRRGHAAGLQAGIDLPPTPVVGNGQVNGLIADSRNQHPRNRLVPRRLIRPSGADALADEGPSRCSR